MEVEESKKQQKVRTIDMQDIESQNSKKRKQKEEETSTMEYEITSSNNNAVVKKDDLPPIHTVPIVILEQIFAYLAPAELQICAFVCKRWKATYESFMDKFEEIKLREMPYFSQLNEKLSFEELQQKIDKELEYEQVGKIRVHQIERTIFLFSIRQDNATVKHVKIEHNYGKWKTLDYTPSTPITAKHSLAHLIRDIIETLINPEKLHVSVPSEKEIEKNDPFTPRVNLDGCVQSFTDKTLIAALKKNCYIRSLHFIGKEWLKESSTEPSWALSCLLDNFSITQATFQYAGSQVNKATAISQRNLRFIPILRVFELCNNDPILQLWAYQSLINEYGKVVDDVSLHYAAAKGMKELTEALLNKRIPAFKPIPETEETAFIFALRNKSNPEIIKLFEKYVSGKPDQPLVGWCGEIDREKAEKYVKGKPQGTFLTRFSPNNAKSYVVTIVGMNDQVYHLAGWKKSEDGSVTAERAGGKYKYYPNWVDTIYDEMIELRYPMKCPIPSILEWKDPKSKP